MSFFSIPRDWPKIYPTKEQVQENDVLCVATFVENKLNENHMSGKYIWVVTKTESGYVKALPYPIRHPHPAAHTFTNEYLFIKATQEQKAAASGFLKAKTQAERLKMNESQEILYRKMLGEHRGKGNVHERSRRPLKEGTPVYIVGIPSLGGK